MREVLRNKIFSFSKYFLCISRVYSQTDTARTATRKIDGLFLLGSFSLSLSHSEISTLTQFCTQQASKPTNQPAQNSLGPTLGDIKVQSNFFYSLLS